ncbi:MAG: hypothetical protein MSS13_05290 [Sutterella parvirubra]|uniref:Uncharacterized protein n=1 Tax=Sutterella parvirubra YIT 11816 TaxID=762967 RepID=H3KEV7_9BURK|nr:hypothetical protein HMPREF9440_01272 [Sutterella parvirubra YIT 11816]MCI7709122.1 hypothetical protein [Sutterella parvirubra]MDY5200695.1 hypothetical protein [Sutterella parvirubra]
MTLLPVPLVIALIVMKKPTIPTFIAGIVTGALLAVGRSREFPGEG